MQPGGDGVQAPFLLAAAGNLFRFDGERRVDELEEALPQLRGRDLGATNEGQETGGDLGRHPIAGAAPVQDVFGIQGCLSSVEE
jgi:hypothetical protein